MTYPYFRKGFKNPPLMFFPSCFLLSGHHKGQELRGISEVAALSPGHRASPESQDKTRKSACGLGVWMRPSEGNQAQTQLYDGKAGP